MWVSNGVPRSISRSAAYTMPPPKHVRQPIRHVVDEHLVRASNSTLTRCCGFASGDASSCRTRSYPRPFWAHHHKDQHLSHWELLASAGTLPAPFETRRGRTFPHDPDRYSLRGRALRTTRRKFLVILVVSVAVKVECLFKRAMFPNAAEATSGFNVEKKRSARN